VCSTILYLSDAGGPTVVLDQQPGTALALVAWLVSPQSGRLAAFDGSLLHGVLPGAACSLCRAHKIAVLQASCRGKCGT
jgi:hypothetical protein